MTSRRDVPARVSAGGMIHPGREIALRSPRPRQRGRNESRASCGSRPTLRRNLAARTAQRAIPTCRTAVAHHRRFGKAIDPPLRFFLNGVGILLMKLTSLIPVALAFFVAPIGSAADYVP